MIGRTLKRVLAIGAISAALAGCSDIETSFLAPAGMVADAQARWLVQITLWMLIVVAPVLVLVPFFAWRYRRRNTNAAYKPNWDFSWPLEIAVWGVPVLIVAVLAIHIAGVQRRFDPYAPLPGAGAPMEIDVVGLNWKWLFIYPEQHIASVGTMAFSADRPVLFKLTSDKTIQSFLIPALGSQIYAMAGMVTQLNLKADHPGRFIGENTQFNGFEFQQDRFVARAMTAGDFASWVSAARAAARPLDHATFERLARDGTLNQALTAFGADPTAAGKSIPQFEPGLAFSDVDPEIFQGVVQKFHAMGSMNMPNMQAGGTGG